MVEIAPLVITATDLALPTGPVSGKGWSIAPALPLSRWSLRARDPDMLAEVTGRAMPARIGEMLHGIVRLGPDEWLALLPDAPTLPSGDGKPVSVTDVTARSVGLVLEGERAAALVQAGCPLDIERMAPGRATRTLFETVEILVWRQEPARFHLEVWRSFAPWLHAALAAGGAD